VSRFGALPREEHLRGTVIRVSNTVSPDRRRGYRAGVPSPLTNVVEVDGRVYAAAPATMHVTRLPRRLSLHLEVRSSEPRGPSLTICDQRIPGTDLVALDGAVIERASGDQPSHRDPRAVVSVLGFYLNDHLELRNNRLRFQQQTTDQVELTWEATMNNVDRYEPGSPPSVMRAALTLTVEERELVRISWMTTDLQRLKERAADQILDAITPVHTEVRSRLAERGRELAASGWFEGRPIHAIELAVRVMPENTDAPPRCGPSDDGVATVHIHVSRERFETDRADAGATILAEVDRALPLLDVRHPRAPRVLRGS